MDQTEFWPRLSPEKVQSFSDFCSDEENINRFGVDLISEIAFLERHGIGPNLATDTVEELLFIWESPFSDIENDVRSMGEPAVYKFAANVHWCLRQAIRARIGLVPLTESEQAEWLELPSYHTRLEKFGARTSGEVSKNKFKDDCVDQAVLSEGQAIMISEYIKKDFPEIFDYYMAVSQEAPESTGQRVSSFGGLPGPARTIFLARNCLFGAAGVNDPENTSKIISAMINSAETTK